MLRPHSSIVKLVTAMAADKQVKEDNLTMMFVFATESEVRYQAQQVRNRVIMYAMRGDNWNGEAQ